MVQGIEVETQGRGQSTAGRGAGCSRVAGGQGVGYKGSWLRAANGVERRWEGVAHGVGGGCAWRGRAVALPCGRVLHTTKDTWSVFPIAHSP